MDTETYWSREHTTGAEISQKTRKAATNNYEFYHKPQSTPKRLKRPRQRRVGIPKYPKWNSYHNKRNGGLFSHETLLGEK
jgi:hypothetical protein